MRALIWIGLFVLPFATFAEEPPSKNWIVKLTDAGLEPALLKIKKKDGIVFFLNDTKAALTTMQIDFTGETTHCASSNMAIGADSIIRSTKPFGPSDFATTCFHSPGDYKLTVYGLAAQPQGVQGRIIVE